MQTKERERFTAWLSKGERQAIRDRADEMHCSQNYLVRTAIRKFLGFDGPPAVTDVTRNNRDN